MDSFGPGLRPFLSEDFSRVVYLWQENAGTEYLESRTLDMTKRLVVDASPEVILNVLTSHERRAGLDSRKGLNSVRPLRAGPWRRAAFLWQAPSRVTYLHRLSTAQRRGCRGVVHFSDAGRRDLVDDRADHILGLRIEDRPTSAGRFQLYPQLARP